MSKEKKQITTLSIILIITTAIFFISSVILGIFLINAFNEKTNITRKLDEIKEELELQENNGAAFWFLANSYCEIYIKDDEDFCIEHNQELVEQLIDRS